MDELTWRDFETFFQSLHGVSPFPWQNRLAKRVCETGWPGVLDLPTASGKTACLDIAVFAMAVRQCGPRRMFFVVDRRVVVDAAFERMRRIVKKLAEAKQGVLKTVAERLRAMAGGDEPLTAYQMRGGIYRDDSWVRSPLQPVLIASTVDQTGSRLLFRGYGVWDKALSIHAGLVANDSLILLDEAHCSRPFAETLAAIQRYQGNGWAESDLHSPFAFVEMTATPAAQTGERFGLEDEDYAHPEMRKRLYARKPVRLLASKARLKDFRKLAESLVDEAERLSEKPGLRRIAVMVNRVQTARLAYEILKARERRAHLLIGRMRPVDRMELPSDLEAMLSGKKRADGEPVFMVATQCLEVGADLDFDAVVTECASIDALLQRFGRLDRIGDLQIAEGAVMIVGPMADAKYSDPVYGPALTKTWNWLNIAGESLNFGICSEAGDETVRERLQRAGEEAGGLRRVASHAPMLLPAHLDVLAQTSPRPAIEPDISLYLHGEESGPAEVQVLWRADLDADRPEQWAEIVSMCPPVSMEAMPVPYRSFLAWLAESKEGNASPDIEGFDEPIEEGEDGRLRCPVLRWRGDESEAITEHDQVRRIRPGDTLILAGSGGGWNDLGHVPEEAESDVAEKARYALKSGWVLRLHRSLLERWPETPARQKLIELAGQPAVETREIVEALKEYRESLAGYSGWLIEMLRGLPKGVQLEAYPESDGVPAGYVLSATFVEADAGGDESSAASSILLDEHLKHVTEAVRKQVPAVLEDEAVCRSAELAAQLHDYGKADPRFQALLRGGDPMAAQFAPKLLAKGAQARRGRQVRNAQWARSGLPDGFRHESISLLLAQMHAEAGEDDLALHLIASHHGRCRPFAPVVDDRGGPLCYDGLVVTGEQRIEGAAHRLESGVADRFWRLTRRYGWWGLAYLETLMRLGDWQASKDEDEIARAKRSRP
jgi:CRISPR-associated endonuclease/helicase Cas3